MLSSLAITVALMATAATAQAPECLDTDGDATTATSRESGPVNCTYFNSNPDECDPDLSDADFDVLAMCCGCGGGSTLQTTTTVEPTTLVTVQTADASNCSCISGAGPCRHLTGLCLPYLGGTTECLQGLADCSAAAETTAATESTVTADVTETTAVGETDCSCTLDTAGPCRHPSGLCFPYLNNVDGTTECEGSLADCGGVDTTTKACFDIDNGGLDEDGYGCDHYAADPSSCYPDGHFDTTSFTLEAMCCGCGGGSTAATTSIPARTTTSAEPSTDSTTGTSPGTTISAGASGIGVVTSTPETPVFTTVGPPGSPTLAAQTTVATESTAVGGTSAVTEAGAQDLGNAAAGSTTSSDDPDVGAVVGWLFLVLFLIVAISVGTVYYMRHNRQPSENNHTPWAHENPVYGNPGAGNSVA